MAVCKHSVCRHDIVTGVVVGVGGKLDWLDSVVVLPLKFTSILVD